MKSKDREQEFARCTIDSSSSHRSAESNNYGHDANEGYTKKSSKRRYPELFRGTGQNGQIMKEDLKSWSRKLHN